MKHFLTLLLVTNILHAAAQKEVNPDKSNISFVGFESHIYTLSKPANTIKPGFLITDVEVIDSRFDTSTLGFMQENFPDNKRILKLKKGTTNDIRAYLLASINGLNPVTDTVGYTLVCLIKKLWLSDEIYESEIDTSWSAKGNNVRRSGVITHFDFLVKKNDIYIPLYKFDTVIADKKNIYRWGDNYIAEALSASLERLSSFSATKLTKSKKKYSWDKIEEYNGERFKIPILLEKPQKGVFVTFDEFKNNTPSIKEYKISPGSKTDQLYYMDESGKELLFTDIYGYSDGENIYIASGNNFFRLYRTDNTFNIWGSKVFKKRKNKNIGGSLALMAVTATAPLMSKAKTGATYSLRLNPFQLDMETGIIY